tara:strand:- start:221 stop:856 length:636 start_codon:yes stop_codon:yes gene_type:complete
MNLLIKKIDQIIEDNSLLKHPFYQMWSDGKLEFESLVGYAKEYYQLVREVPNFMKPIIEMTPSESKSELIGNMEEETQHIGLWEKFAFSMGIDIDELTSYQGLKKTQNAVNNLASLMTSYDEGGCAMYAFEKEIPKISKTKIEGLKNFYGLDNKNSIQYFEEHMTADIRHTASWEKIIDNSSKSDAELLEIAKKSINAQNLLLDSCYEAYC